MKRAVLVAVSAAALLVGFGSPVVVPAAGQGGDRDQVTRDFIEALAVVEQHYADELDYERVSKTAIYGMLRTLDPHSLYFDRAEFEEFMTDQQSQYFGVGAVIGQRGPKVYVVAPYAGAPAERAGFRYGDEIVEIDGQSTEGWPMRAVSEKMRGPRGTRVKISVRRPGVAEPIVAEIVRDAVPQPTVTNAYMITPGVGYIHQQRGWDQTSAREVMDAIARLKGEGMHTLVYDLRGNPGGLVREAVTLANQFLYKGQNILSMRGRSNVSPNREFAAWNEAPHMFPIVVLVDGNSASASEILAGALQDHDRALIVGDTSFGKGLTQYPFELEKNGGALILTTGKYYTPSGRSIQRDYSSTSMYDYFLHRTEADASTPSKVFRTDSGRPLYGGGGITPDVKVVAQEDVARMTLKWFDATFLFTREVINGRIKGFEPFAFSKLSADHVVRPSEFVISDAYLAAFEKFISTQPTLNVKASMIGRDRRFLEHRLRFELVSAHHGLETAAQVTALLDPQLQRALAEVPLAGDMAEAFQKRNRPGASEVSSEPPTIRERIGGQTVTPGAR